MHFTKFCLHNFFSQFSLLHLLLLLLSSQASFKDGEEERKRILHGLGTLLDDDGDRLVEAREFLKPVDFVKESKYCKAVAYPTSLSTIIEKLKNKFYRLV